MGAYVKVRSVYLNEADLNILENLVKQGYYPNISEAIRVAIKDLIKYHQEALMVQKVKEETT